MAQNPNKIPHRDRKNGGAREAWQKRKHETNQSRGPQNLFPYEVDGELEVRRTR